MSFPLMPKSTAVWLIDNTTLTFEQISEFCGLHALETKGIADGDVARGIKGMDPIATGQLTRNELERCQKSPSEKLQLSTQFSTNIPEKKGVKYKYTPLSKRMERTDAIYWLVRNHPELKDAQIIRLVRTTKPTIQSIRTRTHWKINTLKPIDPVALGLCTQVNLDKEVTLAAKRVEKLQQNSDIPDAVETLAPVNSNSYDIDFNTPSSNSESPIPDVDTVFGNFNKSDKD